MATRYNTRQSEEEIFSVEMFSFADEPILCLENKTKDKLKIK